MAGRLDVTACAAIVLTFFGWFVLDTFRVDWGPLRQGVHFYELVAVIRTPARFFMGSEDAHGMATVPFALLCIATLLVPLTPYIWRNRLAWLSWLAPFALIFVVAGYLYVHSSGKLLPEHNLADTLGNDFRHLANHLVHRAGAGVARKVTFGAGGYVALIGSAWLALRGLRAMRHRTPFERGPR